MKNLFINENYKVLGIILILLPALLMTGKFVFWDYSFTKILPEKTYNVNFIYDFEAFSEPVFVKSFIPGNNNRQAILQEGYASSNMELEVKESKNGRKAIWNGNSVSGPHTIIYDFSFKGTSIAFEIDSLVTIETSFSESMQTYLRPSDYIQVNHPVIGEIFNQDVSKSKYIKEVLKSVHQYVLELTPAPFKGLTDAVTAARLGEASCNGKSRLFVALARHAGIPSRLVGGLILEPGFKRTTHQWVEAYINGTWVPFDPLNDHFAFIPGNYLETYKGDEFLLSHTPNINFDYHFQINEVYDLVPDGSHELAAHPLSAYNVWNRMKKSGVPLGILTIMLVLPIGATLVAIFRNVIGINTFGIFLPVLIAVSSKETGIVAGITTFITVIAFLSIIHKLLDIIGLLYVPKVAIMLVCVILTLMGMSVLGAVFELSTFSKVSFFPVIVMTIAAEKFSTSMLEEGWVSSLQLVGQTLLVSLLIYLIIGAKSVEVMFVAFPELFLVIIAINLFLGKWIGLRVTEYPRFKWILK